MDNKVLPLLRSQYSLYRAIAMGLPLFAILVLLPLALYLYPLFQSSNAKAWQFWLVVGVVIVGEFCQCLVFIKKQKRIIQISNFLQRAQPEKLVLEKVWYPRGYSRRNVYLYNGQLTGSRNGTEFSTEVNFSNGAEKLESFAEMEGGLYESRGLPKPVRVYFGPRGDELLAVEIDGNWVLTQRAWSANLIR